MRYISSSLEVSDSRIWPYLITRQTRWSIIAQTPIAPPPCATCEMEDYFNLKCARLACQALPNAEKHPKKTGVLAKFRIFGCADNARQT